MVHMHSYVGCATWRSENNVILNEKRHRFYVLHIEKLSNILSLSGNTGIVTRFTYNIYS